MCEIACEIIDRFFDLEIQTKKEDEQTKYFFSAAKIERRKKNVLIKLIETIEKNEDQRITLKTTIKENENKRFIILLTILSRSF
ncbi:hypothetical protein H0242_25110 [Bacillus thuringiensis serovar sumiyoshiensis]|uniref:hypothetical protein n=1 Tax=Bacillus thuringiensis TaxID=1428 RepID=UPI001298755A